MPWTRFVFALGDAACAELVTAFERYLASGSCSHPDPVGLVSEWGGGRREGGLEWKRQQVARPSVAARPPSAAGCGTFCPGRRVGTASRVETPARDGTGESSERRGWSAFPRKSRLLHSSRPVPGSALAVTADTADQEGAERETFQQTWEMMLNLQLPGASIDLKTQAAARRKKSSKRGLCMGENTFLLSP